MPEFLESDDDAVTPEQMAEFVLSATSEQIDLLNRFIQVRRQAIREMETIIRENELYVGDRVYLTGVSPKKLNNKLATIIDIPEVGKFKVELDNPDKNWHKFVVTASCLRKWNG